MSLAREERPIRAVDDESAVPLLSAEPCPVVRPAPDAGPRSEPGTDHAPDPGIVIAVARTPAHRLRIADAVGDTAPLLLVSSVEEAMVLLAARVTEERYAAGEFARHAGDTDDPRYPGDRQRPEDLGDRDAGPAPGSGSGALMIDSDARSAICGEREVDLSPLEHDLLLILREASGHIRTFDWLQRHVWHNDYQGGRTHVQSVVKRLRRKLGSIGSPLQIETVRGVGLRLTPARP